MFAADDEDPRLATGIVWAALCVAASGPAVGLVHDAIHAAEDVEAYGVLFYVMLALLMFVFAAPFALLVIWAIGTPAHRMLQWLGWTSPAAYVFTGAVLTLVPAVALSLRQEGAHHLLNWFGWSGPLAALVLRLGAGPGEGVTTRR